MSRDYPDDWTEDDERRFLDSIEAGWREDLAMYEAEHACPECGHRNVWVSALEVAPVECPGCGDEMIGLPHLRKLVAGRPNPPGVGNDPEDPVERP